MEHSAQFWVGFHLIIALLIALDLGIFHRRDSLRKSLISSVLWIVIALLFNLYVYFSSGFERALQFFTGYLIEKSLSLDNLFMFLMIFLNFHIPTAYQRKVLFWGIFGAVIFRLSLILAGIALIQRFHWMFYVFGAFLVLSGIKFLLRKKQDATPSRGFFFKALSRLLPIAEGDSKGHFFVRDHRAWKATSLLLALLTIEGMDIVFALDSIPAVFAITTDPFIVYTSNLLAILGLRSLYFVLSGILIKLKHLKVGLAALLIFIGSKMLLAPLFSIPLLLSLAVIVIILGVTVWLSVDRGR